MKGNRFKEEQIIRLLQEAESGLAVAHNERAGLLVIGLFVLGQRRNKSNVMYNWTIGRLLTQANSISATGKIKVCLLARDS